MNFWTIIIFLSVIPLKGWAGQAPSEQFLANVQFSFHESSPEMLARAEEKVRKQLFATFEGWPAIRGRRYDIHRTAPNQLVFTFVTEEDRREKFRESVAAIVQSLSGKVKASGRSNLYRIAQAAFSQPVTDGMGRGFEIETVSDGNDVKILSIRAKSVPARDLLEALAQKVPSLNYMHVDTKECFDRLVSWNFSASDESGPRTIGEAMEDIANLLRLKIEKKNGVYFFGGQCQLPSPPEESGPPPDLKLLPSSMTILPPRESTMPQAAHVYFRMMPAN
ncbi:MAG: hypothetical protein HY537_18250 [Deltaproteobacteria bacterium]|nr:hypothetical protein [Deltaproteobacteria bacterium]